jgi:hypothetical protein
VLSSDAGGPIWLGGDREIFLDQPGSCPIRRGPGTAILTGVRTSAVMHSADGINIGGSI